MTWEPLTRTFIYQKFNLTEGGQLVTDLYQAAVNFTARTGAGLEIEHARHLYARYVKNNMEMKHAIELEMEDHKHSSARVRNKRNIFGSIISSLTGLATGREALTSIKTWILVIYQVGSSRVFYLDKRLFNSLVALEDYSSKDYYFYVR